MSGPSVVMVAYQYPPVYGGAGEQALQLARSLVANQWNVTVVTLDQARRGPSRDGSLVVQRCGGIGRGRLSRAKAALVLGVRSAAWILRRRPTAVHIHGCYWWSLPPAIAARICGARLVVKSTRDGEDDPETVRSKSVGGVAVGLLYALPMRLADVVVVLNSDAEAKARRVGLGQKCLRLTNGVDIEPRAKTDTRAPREVVYVGYLVRHKGVFDLLEAWRILAARGLDARLRLVGPSDTMYREVEDSDVAEFRRLASELGAELVGAVDRKSVLRILSSSTVFCLPSYAEGMPNSLLEAVSAGCRVVASDIPGIRELALDEVGVLVRPGDVAGLADALADALARGRPSSSAAARAAAPYSWETLRPIYERLYRGELRAQRRGDEAMT